MKTWQEEKNSKLLSKYKLQYENLTFLGSSEEEVNKKLDDEALTNRIIYELIVPMSLFTVSTWSICFLSVYYYKQLIYFYHLIKVFV